VTTVAKQRAVALLVAALALWPLVHFALTRAYGIDPWKYFGWAMYATPPPSRSEVAVVVRSGSGDLTLSRAQLSGKSRLELERFQDRRARWGSLATPRLLATRLFDEHLDVRSITVVVTTPRLSPRDGYVYANAQQYEYLR